MNRVCGGTASNANDWTHGIRLILGSVEPELRASVDELKAALAISENAVQLTETELQAACRAHQQEVGRLQLSNTELLAISEEAVQLKEAEFQNACHAHQEEVGRLQLSNTELLEEHRHEATKAAADSREEQARLARLADSYEEELRAQKCEVADPKLMASVDELKAALAEVGKKLAISEEAMQLKEAELQTKCHARQEEVDHLQLRNRELLEEHRHEATKAAADGREEQARLTRLVDSHEEELRVQNCEVADPELMASVDELKAALADVDNKLAISEDAMQLKETELQATCHAHQEEVDHLQLRHSELFKEHRRQAKQAAAVGREEQAQLAQLVDLFKEEVRAQKCEVTTAEASAHQTKEELQEMQEQACELQDVSYELRQELDELQEVIKAKSGMEQDVNSSQEQAGPARLVESLQEQLDAQKRETAEAESQSHQMQKELQRMQGQVQTLRHEFEESSKQDSHVAEACILRSESLEAETPTNQKETIQTQQMPGALRDLPQANEVPESTSKKKSKKKKKSKQQLKDETEDEEHAQLAECVAPCEKHTCEERDAAGKAEPVASQAEKAIGDVVQTLRLELDECRFQELQMQEACAQTAATRAAPESADEQKELQLQQAQSQVQELQEVAKALQFRNEELQLQEGSKSQEECSHFAQRLELCEAQLSAEIQRSSESKQKHAETVERLAEALCEKKSQLSAEIKRGSESKQKHAETVERLAEALHEQKSEQAALTKKELIRRQENDLKIRQQESDLSRYRVREIDLQDALKKSEQRNEMSCAKVTDLEEAYKVSVSSHRQMQGMLAQTQVFLKRGAELEEELDACKKENMRLRQMQTQVYGAGQTQMQMMTMGGYPQQAEPQQALPQFSWHNVSDGTSVPICVNIQNAFPTMPVSSVRPMGFSPGVQSQSSNPETPES